VSDTTTPALINFRLEIVIRLTSFFVNCKMRNAVYYFFGQLATAIRQLATLFANRHICNYSSRAALFMVN
jgi:hypothetical protein